MRMIKSVSTLARIKGAAGPESFVNFSMIPDPFYAANCRTSAISPAKAAAAAMAGEAKCVRAAKKRTHIVRAAQVFKQDHHGNGFRGQGDAFRVNFIG
jgi:hypothetical protein